MLLLKTLNPELKGIDFKIAYGLFLTEGIDSPAYFLANINPDLFQAFVLVKFYLMDKPLKADLPDRAELEGNLATILGEIQAYGITMPESLELDWIVSLIMNTDAPDSERDPNDSDDSGDLSEGIDNLNKLLGDD
jgi:hypothetical protein